MDLTTLIIMKCFELNKNINSICKKEKCRYWINSKKNGNCCIATISNNKDNLTLEEIGKLFNVTRMRICQIEKIAINKLKNFFK